MRGMDAIRRRIGSVKQVIRDTPDTAKEVLTEWAETKWKPLAQAIAPVDTGEFRDLLDYEVTADQVKLLGRADHSEAVELGSSTHAAQPTIRPALEQTRREIGVMMRAKLKDQLK